jgi:multidrug efflux pump subunit AcrA (membrane-fusion protein)
LDRLGQQVDRQTHELLVDVTVLAHPPRLSLGQRADVTVILERRPSVLRIPRAFWDEPTATVVAMRDGRTVSVPVRPGLIGPTHVEIRGGLRAGDQVVRSPQPGKTLPLGRPVRIEVP